MTHSAQNMGGDYVHIRKSRSTAATLWLVDEVLDINWQCVLTAQKTQLYSGML